MAEYINYFLISKRYDSITREIFITFLIKFGIPKKSVRLINMCLSKTYSRVRVGRFLSDTFPIHCGLTQEPRTTEVVAARRKYRGPCG